VRESIEYRVEQLELSIEGGSGLTVAYTAASGTYTALSTDYVINCTANTFTVNLPTAVGISGTSYVIKNSGAGVITVDGNGSQTIDGATTVTLYQYDSITIVSDGSNWIII
jgi:phage gp45-like